MVTFPTDISVLPIVPPLMMLATALVVILADLFLFKEGEKHATVWLALLGLGATLVATLVTWASLGGRSVSAFAGLVTLDTYALMLDVIIIIVTAIVMLLSAEYLVEQNIEHAEFYTLLLLSAMGMMIMGRGVELISLWVGFETFSIALYVLAAYARPKLESEEAGLKYFFLGTFAAGFFLYGIAMTYAATGTTRLAGIADFIRVNQANIGANTMLFVGLGLMLVGLSFKVALVPFHQWTPDVYDGAPTAVTAFMATATKAAGFALLMRVLLVAFPAPAMAAAWTGILALLAALTMIVGNVVALMQRNMKRLLAYSSIAQAGYIMIAVVAGGSGGVTAAMYYLLAYAVMTLGAFGVVIALNRGGDEMLELNSYAGLSTRAPFLAMSLAVFMFALTGFPPLAGFVGKWYIFQNAVDSGWAWLAVVGALTSVVSAGYYLYVVVLMYMRPAPENAPVIGDGRGPAGTAVALALVATLLLGLFSAPIFNLAPQLQAAAVALSAQIPLR